MTPSSRYAPFIVSAARCAAGFILVGLVGWLCLTFGGHPTWRDISLAGLPAIAALLGGPWYVSRVRAERRWRAALDRCAEREIARQQA